MRIGFSREENLIPHCRRKTGAFSGLPHSPEKENGYRLRETDLRLKRPKPAQVQSGLASLKQVRWRQGD